MRSVTCICPGCEKTFTFEVKTGGKRFYCDDCRTSRNQTHAPRRPKSCEACGTQFVGGTKQKFCSHTCRNERNKREAEQRRAAAALATEKLCGKCDRVLAISEFRKDKNRLDGLYCWCNDCNRSYHGTRKFQPSSWKSKADYGQNYRRVHKHRLAQSYTARYLWTQYRMTVEQFDALYEAQGGQCAICNVPAENLKYRLSVDHDHACCSGSRSCGACVRGLLCSGCNAAIGFMKDSPSNLRAAMRYLKSPPARTTDDESPGERMDTQARMKERQR